MDRQILIDRLLESENLTDNLEDEDANVLIKWGIAQLDHLILDARHKFHCRKPIRCFAREIA